MRYHNITHDDMKNGDGLRVVLWVAGCLHHCPNCHNPVTWDEMGGLVFDQTAFEELCAALRKPYTSGITLSGGDPLHPVNRPGVLDLVQTLKQLFPTKTIWLYTGYTWEEVIDQCFKYREILNYIDVLVDGRYEEAKKDVNYHWAGSTNQRVIDVPESIKEGCVKLHESD